MVDLRIAALRIGGLILIVAGGYFLAAVAGLNPQPHFEHQAADAATGTIALFTGLALLVVRSD